MSELIENTARFIKQHIELYGDELAFDKNLRPHVEKYDAPIVQTPIDWQDCRSLDDLYPFIGTCEKCNLHKSRKSVVVGSGSQNAKIMIIGHIPSLADDNSGAPFSGDVGDLLSKMLAAIDLDKKDVYLSNIIKCRPHGRDPLKTEIEMCALYLQKQIEIIRPMVILCFGQAAAQSLLQSTMDFSQMRGQTFHINDSNMIVSHHPAMLLQNPALKREAWEDLQRLQCLMNELSQNK